MFFIQLTRVLPLLVILALIAGIVYFFVQYRSSPNHAKEVLIKSFTWLTGILSGLFSLATLYAWAENNLLVAEVMLSFVITALIGLGIVTICRAVFLKHNPKYRKKPVKTKRMR